MRDLKLLRIGKDYTHQVVVRGATVEKSLQTHIERNLETLLGVRFLETEFGSNPAHMLLYLTSIES